MSLNLTPGPLATAGLLALLTASLSTSSSLRRQGITLAGIPELSMPQTDPNKAITLVALPLVGYAAVSHLELNFLESMVALGIAGTGALIYRVAVDETVEALDFFASMVSPTVKDEDSYYHFLPTKADGTINVDEVRKTDFAQPMLNKLLGQTYKIQLNEQIVNFGVGVACVVGGVFLARPLLEQFRSLSGY